MAKIKEQAEVKPARRWKVRKKVLFKSLMAI